MAIRRDGSVIQSGTRGLLRERVGIEQGYQRVRHPFLRIWPNGQYSLSYKYRTESKPLVQEDEWLFLRGGGYRRSRAERTPILVSTQQSSQGTQVGQGRVMKKYGLKGITSHGQRMVKSGAAMLQRKFHRSNLTFMTLTVPALERRERELIARSWGEIMRQTLQWIGRRLRASKQPALIVSVTELQCARFQRYSEAYLHAHLVFPARVSGSRRWAIDVSEFRTWYKSLLERILGCEINQTPRVETKLVKKSAENYLGKYMSKGAGDIQGIVSDLGEGAVPGQQWNMSGDMRSWVKAAIAEGYDLGSIMQLHLEMMVAGEGNVPGWHHRVEVDYHGRKITTCWVGRVTHEHREGLLLPTVDRAGIISINRDLKAVIKWSNRTPLTSAV